MDFARTEAEFGRLKAQFESGSLTEAEFKAKLEELMLEDEQGRWWMIGYETGQWYVHDGQEWVLGEPQPTVTRRPQHAAAPHQDGRPDPAASQQHLGEDHISGSKVTARSGSWQRFFNDLLRENSLVDTIAFVGLVIIGLAIGVYIGYNLGDWLPEFLDYHLGLAQTGDQQWEGILMPICAVLGAVLGAIGFRLIKKHRRGSK